MLLKTTVCNYSVKISTTALAVSYIDKMTSQVKSMNRTEIKGNFFEYDKQD